jgi:hypothetical protein
MTIMPLLYAIEFLIAAALGIISHLTIFIRSELDQYAAIIAFSFAIAFIILLLLATVQESSLLDGLGLAIALFLSFQGALGLSITAYRLFFHRTCQFRGPKLGTASKWVAARRAKKDGQYHLYLARLHAEFGDIVRTG